MKKGATIAIFVACWGGGGAVSSAFGGHFEVFGGSWGDLLKSGAVLSAPLEQKSEILKNRAIASAAAPLFVKVGGPSCSRLGGSIIAFGAKVGNFEKSVRKSENRVITSTGASSH